MWKKGWGRGTAQAVALACGAAITSVAPSYALDNTDYHPLPFMVISAPVQFTEAPIGIEAKYSWGSPASNRPVSTQLVRSQPSGTMHFVHVPIGTSMRVALAEAVSTESLQRNPVVQARTTADVKLATGEVLPANTLVVGHVGPGVPGATLIKFDQIQLSDGRIVPISTVLVTAASGPPAPGLILSAGQGAKSFAAGEVLNLRLTAPAQVAVEGGVL